MTPQQKIAAFEYISGWVKAGPIDTAAFEAACLYSKTHYPSDPREIDDEPPSRPESEGEEWDRNTASNEDFLNRERNRA